MIPQLPPPAIENALLILENSNDLGAGEDAFWTVQRFQNQFGLKLAAPSIAVSLVIMALALTGSQRGWTDPLMIGAAMAAGLAALGFVYATRRRAKAAHAAHARITAALRRWRAIAVAAASQKEHA